jgi:hypothetical protein
MLMLACFFVAACAPTKEEMAESIAILRQQHPNVESESQSSLKLSKGFEGISGGKWEYKVVGTKGHPTVAYGYFGHKTLMTYIWDWVKFLPTAVVGVVVIPGWHTWVCYAWDVDIQNHTVEIHKGPVVFP